MRYVVLAGVVVLALGCAKEYPVPRAQVTTPPSSEEHPQQDLVVLPFMLFDLDSLPANIEVQFSTDGTTWKSATKALISEPTEKLSTAPRGVAHCFVWDSRADVGAQNFDAVRLRIRPTTKRTGPWATTGTFRLQNGPWSLSVVIGKGEQPALSAVGEKLFCAFAKDGNIYLTCLDYTANPPTHKSVCEVKTPNGTKSQPAIFAHDDGGTIRIHLAYVLNTGTDKQIYWETLTYDDAKDEYNSDASAQVDADTSNESDSRPVLAFDGTNLHIVWQREIKQRKVTDGWEIRHTIIKNGGNGWEVDARDNNVLQKKECKLEPEPEAVWFAGDNRLWVVYLDAANSGDPADIHARRYNGSGWEDWDTTTPTSLLCDAECASNIHLFCDGSNLYVLFSDTNTTTADNGRDLFLLKYDGTPGTPQQLTDREGDQEAVFITSYAVGEFWALWHQETAFWAGRWSDGNPPSLQAEERIDDDGSGAAKSDFCACYVTNSGNDYIVCAWTDERSGAREVRFAVRKP
ncbi:MAG: hypothetical protein DRP63_01030 [Planctomycetota bacterium]|nr:MAG: hypothetical protein DRP63_01030 [Planctomycetota bacterium]